MSRLSFLLNMPAGKVLFWFTTGRAVTYPIWYAYPHLRGEYPAYRPMIAATKSTDHLNHDDLEFWAKIYQAIHPRGQAIVLEEQVNKLCPD